MSPGYRDVWKITKGFRKDKKIKLLSRGFFQSGTDNEIKENIKLSQLKSEGNLI